MRVAAPWAWTAAALATAVGCATATPKADQEIAAAAVDASTGAEATGVKDAQSSAEVAAVDAAKTVLDDGSTTPGDADVVVADAAAADAKPCQVKPTLASLEKEYFAASCAFGPCHSAAKHAGELVLEEGKSYGQLIGVQALHPGAAGFVRVEPGKPDDSFLYIKVTALQPGQGKLMPVGASEPVDADCGIAALKAWIAAGAPN